MNIASARTAMPPFDQARVDRLMEEAGIDVENGGEKLGHGSGGMELLRAA